MNFMQTITFTEDQAKANCCDNDDDDELIYTHTSPVHLRLLLGMNNVI